MKALLKHFRSMPVEVLARRELEEAQRELLEAETGMDFARAPWSRITQTVLNDSKEL